MEKRALNVVLSRIKHGTLVVEYWDGQKSEYGHGQPRAEVKINRRGLIRRMLRSPSIAIGEAYVNGDVEIKGRLQKLLELADRNRIIMNVSKKPRWQQLQKNKKSNQARLVSHHYDIGNHFYRLWLDETMTYSCAYFHRRTDSLDLAQRQKIDHILKKLHLKQDLELLDIGSGWGHLLIAAAKRYKVRGLGISLSREQVRFAKQLAKKEGVERLVSFKLLNYQDLPASRLFDRIVSVGMYEHVGHNNHRSYFEAVNHHLKDGGISVLHAITHQTEALPDPWLDKYIFPGGYIPSIRETTALLPEYDFYLFDYENLGQHYALTLEHWWKRFEAQKAAVIKLYDERFYRMWQLYLVASMMAFKSGETHLSQWTFKKGPDPSWPLTRAYLYASPNK